MGDNEKAAAPALIRIDRSKFFQAKLVWVHLQIIMVIIDNPKRLLSVVCGLGYRVTNLACQEWDGFLYEYMCSNYHRRVQSAMAIQHGIL
jgi:hypothetical protein